MSFIRVNWPAFVVVGILILYVLCVPMFNRGPWGERVQPAELPGYVVQVQIEYNTYTDIGSGALIDSDLILTCYHNVRDMKRLRSKELRVEFPNGIVRKAKVVRRDPTHDLALLEISPVLVSPVEAGEAVVKGDSVTVYGYPGGYVPAAVSGSVVGFASHSRIGREQDVFILDETGGGGISGGPAVDADGKLVGVLFGSDDYSRITTIDEVRRFLENARE